MIEKISAPLHESVLLKTDDVAQAILQTVAPSGVQEQLALEKIIDLGNIEIEEERYIDDEDFFADLDAEENADNSGED